MEGQPGLGAMREAHGAMMEGHGAMREGHGAMMEGHGARMEGHGAMMEGQAGVDPAAGVAMDTHCHVCGILARTGLHYGAVTCYPCRAFFR